MRVLLVEDDPMIGAALRKGLQQEGHTVDWATDGGGVAAALAAAPYNLVVLDLGLPGKSGLEVLDEIRRRKLPVPVIIVTARDAVQDRVAGLDMGADDYLVKPFDLDELGARIRAVMRRQAGHAGSLLEHGDLALNPATHEVFHDGRPVPVSGREFAILEALLERPGAILSRAQLEDRLYGWDEEVASNAVEVHIHNLRRKLGENVITTVRGVGYSRQKPA
jgi:two-component system, OmpR family, response regulator QseB